MTVEIRKILNYAEELTAQYRATCKEIGDTSVMAEDILTRLIAITDMVNELTGCRVFLRDGKYVLVSGEEVVA